MRTLFMFDAHIVRQDPWSSRVHLGELCATLGRYGSDRALWNGIEPKVLLTKFTTSVPLPCAVRLPIGAERALRRFNVCWDRNAISAWCDLMRDEGQVAAIYRDILQYLVSTYGIECFAYWGSNRTIKNFCEAVGLKSVAMELGPTRSPFRETRYCDFAGVNGDSHSRELDWTAFDPLDLSVWRQMGGIRYDDGAREDAMMRPITSRHAERIYRSDKPLALIAMQLDDDSNCLIHSGYSGMEQMIRETVPKLVNAGWRVLVKPHPGAAPERNSGARKMNVEGHERSREFIRVNFSEDEVVWLDDVPVSEYVSLLAKSDALISVNSSMGFEAMLAGKIAVTLGNAPYNVANGLPTVDDLVSGKIDLARYRDYSQRVCRVMIDYYLQPSNLLSSPTALSRAILRNVELSDAYAQGGVAALTACVSRNPVGLIS